MASRMPLQIITLFIQGLPCGSLSSCIGIFPVVTAQSAQQGIAVHRGPLPYDRMFRLNDNEPIGPSRTVANGKQAGPRKRRNGRAGGGPPPPPPPPAPAT